MVKIRLKRLGRKSKPFYRIVVTDIRNRRDGVPMAELGFYNPLTKELKLDKSAALVWVSKGAKPSDTVKRLIDKASDTAGEVIQLERKVPQKKLAAVASGKQETSSSAAPVVEAVAPVAEAVAPVAEAVVPVAEAVAPAVEAVAPVAEESTPEEAAPPVIEASPSSEAE